MSSALESSSARRSRRAARRDAASLRKKEDVRLAEAQDEISRREAGASSPKAGRRSLIKTGPTGLATNLGGTSA